MRDLIVREALKTMARDAAKRFRELVAAGQEIPYDVHESGNGSALPQYVPLTERFIRDHSTALLELDSFGSACAAIESAELSSHYLEWLGIPVPPDARKRAELAGTVFLCRLWADSTDFTLDADRLTAAIDELEAGGDAAEDEIEVVVPLRGLQMPVVRLELATATIVRADTVDVPPEARGSEGVGAAGWEPTFLAAARINAGEGDEGAPDTQPDAGARAVEAFRQLITALRLFKGGGVALGPYAWTRIRADRWRRIATGAGRPRPGGYRLAESELGDLVIFSRALAYRSTAFGKPIAGSSGPGAALGRAISRFEAGVERTAVLEALNDYLLSLRFLLDGGGPAQLGLSMRVAALCAEPEQRGETKATIDRAVALERELWSGEPAAVSEDAPTHAQTAAAIEELARAILKDAACGHLGNDLRSTADEILLADGLAVGEGEAQHRGGEEEWDPADDADLEDTREDLEPVHEASDDLDEEPAPLREASDALHEEHEESELPEEPDEEREEPAPHPVAASRGAQSRLWMEELDAWREAAKAEGRPTRLQVPEPGGRITVESHPDPKEQNLFTNNDVDHEREAASVTARSSDSRVAELLEARPRHHRKTADRVAYLFPRPETTEWDVREISYDRRRRAEPASQAS